MSFDAVILAGGRARRLGGVAKAQLDIGGTTLLDRVVRAVAGAATIVVVGPEQPAAGAVTWARENPPGGGPVAGLAAALPLVNAPVVLTLAADLPWIAPAVPVLRAAVPPDGAAVLVGADGRRNNLAAAWHTASLRAALDVVGATQGASVRALLSHGTVVDVPDPAGWGEDVDTLEDVARAQARCHS